jgi:NAD(P)-dependent dehydrogenase (short-subunit alcohol dehydrogenase family)
MSNTSGLVFEPHDKVAVVTGAAGGIGLGMARAFTNAGMSVVLADIDADRIEATAAGLREAGHDAIGVATDVSKLDDVQALADAAMDTHGRVDVLCNNAGAAIFAKLFNVTVEDWEWTLGIDLWGPIYGTKIFQPIIQDTATEGGHINTTSSVAGLIAGAAAGPYNVAKSGVIALMATLEREFRIGKSPHHASVLCPGPINTEINRNSARNRRDAAQQTQSEVTDAGAAGKKLGTKMADFLSKGMDPDEVGRIVLDGIVTGRFWMFTHPKMLAIYREQIDMMDPDGLLSMGKLT